MADRRPSRSECIAEITQLLLGKTLSRFRALNRPGDSRKFYRLGYWNFRLKPGRFGFTGRGSPVLKVLIAEDELIIADLLEETLIMSGYEVCGIARTVDEAVALAKLSKPDLAVFDVRLAHGGHAPDIARRIDRQTLGILYATGADARRSALTRADGIAMIAMSIGIEK